jgi:hypothetical protein
MPIIYQVELIILHKTIILILDGQYGSLITRKMGKKEI